MLTYVTDQYLSDNDAVKNVAGLLNDPLPPPRIIFQQQAAKHAFKGLI